jgi:hypothetical protein
MPAREPEPPRSPSSPRLPSSPPPRPTEPPRQPQPNRQYGTSGGLGQMAAEASERKPLMPTERKTRNAARQIEAEKAMADHERDQKAFHDNRARLKAERLARAAFETGVKEKR